jgi:superfamily II DNA or RNA helicase
LFGGNSKKRNLEVTKEINARADIPVVVLTTYKYSSVGLDLANMDTIVLADSTKSQIE